ncbi:MAG: signal recognition particle-docking protein FtsY, partial [Chloroflexi bacterium]
MSVFSRWKEGLSRTSRAAFGQIAAIIGASEITDETWDDLEVMLIQADMGIETASSVMEELKRLARAGGWIRSDQLLFALKSELRRRLIPPPEFHFDAPPVVILVVGVNGSGKTTTIAKLSSFFGISGKKVLLGAADTFRAAAVDQLQVWGERLNVEVI